MRNTLIAFLTAVMVYLTATGVILLNGIARDIHTIASPPIAVDTN